MNDWREINTVGNGPMNPIEPQNQKLTEAVSIYTRYSQPKFWHRARGIVRVIKRVREWRAERESEYERGNYWQELKKKNKLDI